MKFKVGDKVKRIHKIADFESTDLKHSRYKIYNVSDISRSLLTKEGAIRLLETSTTWDAKNFELVKPKHNKLPIWF